MWNNSLNNHSLYLEMYAIQSRRTDMGREEPNLGSSTQSKYKILFYKISDMNVSLTLLNSFN